MSTKLEIYECSNCGYKMWSSKEYNPHYCKNCGKKARLIKSNDPFDVLTKNKHLEE